MSETLSGSFGTKFRGVRWVLALLLLSVSALGIRLALLFALRLSPFFELLVGDAAVYDVWARRLVAGEWVTETGFFQAPLYPFFLAAHYKFFDESLLVVRITQAVLGALSCVMIAEAGRRFCGPRAGLIAGVILALYPPAIFFDSQIHKPALDLFLMSALILAASMSGTRRWFSPALSGVSLGLLMLTRENALLLFPLLLIFHAVQPESNRSARTIRTLLFLFALLVPHLGFGTWRTLPIIGSDSERASIGLPLYMGNRHGASGMYEPLEGQYGNPQGEWIGAKVLAERETGKEMNASEISAFWTRKTFADIFSHPISWFVLMARKFLMTWNRLELSDILDIRSHADFAPWLGWLGVIFNFGVLAPLAICSAWILRGQWRGWWILGAMTVLFSMSVVLFYVSARYRYPLVPVLAVMAGAGIDGARGIMQAASRHARFRSIFVLFFALLFANIPILPSRFAKDQHSFSYYNAGTGWAEKGRDGTAIGCYAKAIELMPDNESAIFQLGLAMERAGELEQAFMYLSQAAQLKPDRAETFDALARIMTGMGKPEESKLLTEQATALRARAITKERGE